MIYNQGMTQPPAYPPGFPPAYSPEPTAIPVEPGYPVASAYTIPQPEKKSPVLGVIGLGIVAICGIVFYLCSKGMFDVAFDAMGPNWDPNTVPDATTFTQEQLDLLSGPTKGSIFSTVIGIVGFVLSIVATAQNKGRVFAIIGIVLGVLAPASFFLAMVVSAAAHGAM